MLKRLIINNIAIIKHTEIEFCDKFNVITGETGAGKSIIINSLKLLLGKRIKNNIIRANETTASVEALFEFDKNNIIFSKLEDIGILGLENEIIIKRIISSNKQNRVYINGSLVTLKNLESIAVYLFGISSQSEQNELFSKDFHRLILDKYSLLEDKLKEFKILYSEYKNKLNELNKYIKKEEDFLQKKDFYNFVLEEIEKINPKKGELESLEQELGILENTEEIKSFYESLSSDLYYDRNSSYSKINDLINKSEGIRQYLDESILNSLEEIYYSIENIASDSREKIAQFSVDEDDIISLKERYNDLSSLYSKHGGSEKTFFEKQEKILQEINEQDLLTINISNLKDEIKKLSNNLNLIAEHIHKIRIENSSKMKKEIENTLNLLGMKNTRLKIIINKKPFDKIDSFGISDVEFFIKTNLNGDFERFKNILSGGELSRILLAIKKILSSFESKPYIFDEVDQGTGGDISKQIGSLLEDVSKKEQIIVITHLIQVAALADRHFFVEKIDSENETFSNIKMLNNKEKELELSRMIGSSDMEKTKYFIKSLVKKEKI